MPTIARILHRGALSAAPAAADTVDPASPAAVSVHAPATTGTGPDGSCSESTG
ncbi:hypothetical protein [Streptomonospora salina]|uniref:Uncharacterized protein n=1 Tax=Streptomonospora salina TaxID=104205 RepID=A0A841E747_9ACTN|nr:hypothetical protein [Streptomonospora salina]MBB5997119.1 hypothetical protein [Streptomonospora salina]